MPLYHKSVLRTAAERAVDAYIKDNSVVGLGHGTMVCSMKTRRVDVTIRSIIEHAVSILFVQVKQDRC